MAKKLPLAKAALEDAVKEEAATAQDLALAGSTYEHAPPGVDWLATKETRWKTVTDAQQKHSEALAKEKKAREALNEVEESCDE